MTSYGRTVYDIMYDVIRTYFFWTHVWRIMTSSLYDAHMTSYSIYNMVDVQQGQCVLSDREVLFPGPNKPSHFVSIITLEIHSLGEILFSDTSSKEHFFSSENLSWISVVKNEINSFRLLYKPRCQWGVRTMCV